MAVIKGHPLYSGVIALIGKAVDPTNGDLIRDEQGNPKSFYRGINPANRKHYDASTRFSNKAHWFTDNEKLATMYANGRSSMANPHILYSGGVKVHAHVTMSNPHIVDMAKQNLSKDEHSWTHDGRTEIGFRKERELKYARDNGHDGVLFHNALDGHDIHGGTIAAVFDPGQIHEIERLTKAIDPRDKSTVAMDFDAPAEEQEDNRYRMTLRPFGSFNVPNGHKLLNVEPGNGGADYNHGYFTTDKPLPPEHIRHMSLVHEPKKDAFIYDGQRKLDPQCGHRFTAHARPLDYEGQHQYYDYSTNFDPHHYDLGDYPVHKESDINHHWKHLMPDTKQNRDAYGSGWDKDIQDDLKKAVDPKDKNTMAMDFNAPPENVDIPRYDGATIHADRKPGGNVNIKFDGRPQEHVLAHLKNNKFRYNPDDQAWYHLHDKVSESAAHEAARLHQQGRHEIERGLTQTVGNNQWKHRGISIIKLHGQGSHRQFQVNGLEPDWRPLQYDERVWDHTFKSHRAAKDWIDQVHNDAAKGGYKALLDRSKVKVQGEHFVPAQSEVHKSFEVQDRFKNLSLVIVGRIAI